MQGRDVISFTSWSDKLSAANRKRVIWIALALAVLASVQIYYVQEMLAALLILTILLFVCASKPIVVWAEPRAVRLVHQGIEAFKGLTAHPVWARAIPHRFR